MSLGTLLHNIVRLGLHRVGPLWGWTPPQQYLPLSQRGRSHHFYLMKLCTCRPAANMFLASPSRMNLSSCLNHSHLYEPSPAIIYSHRELPVFNDIRCLYALISNENLNFFLRCLALWLSHWITYSCWVSPSSFKNRFIHNISSLTFMTTMYSAYVVESATHFCNFDCQDIAPPAKVTKVPWCASPRINVSGPISSTIAYNLMWFYTETQIGLCHPFEMPHNPL